MQKFIQGAASLAWKMVNQRPVMVFLKVEAREKFDSTVQVTYILQSQRFLRESYTDLQDKADTEKTI